MGYRKGFSGNFGKMWEGFFDKFKVKKSDRTDCRKDIKVSRTAHVKNGKIGTKFYWNEQKNILHQF